MMAKMKGEVKTHRTRRNEQHIKKRKRTFQAALQDACFLIRDSESLNAPSPGLSY
jgi:hypothetical protein